MNRRTKQQIVEDIEGIVVAYRCEILATLADMMDSLKEDGGYLESVIINIDASDEISVDIKASPR